MYQISFYHTLPTKAKSTELHHWAS